MILSVSASDRRALSNSYRVRRNSTTANCRCSFKYSRTNRAKLLRDRFSFFVTFISAPPCEWFPHPILSLALTRYFFVLTICLIFVDSALPITQDFRQLSYLFSAACRAL